MRRAVLHTTPPALKPCTEPLHSMHMACASAHCVLRPAPGLPPTRCTRLHGCAWGLRRCGGLMRRAVLHTTPPALKPCTETLHSMHMACASAHCVLRPAPGLPPTRCTWLHGCAWGLRRCGGLMRRAVLHTTPPALKPCTEPLHSMHMACASAHCVLTPAPGLPPTRCTRLHGCAWGLRRCGGLMRRAVLHTTPPALKPCTETLHSMHMACASAHCVLRPAPGLPPTRCTWLHGCAWGLRRCGGLMRRAVLHTTPPALKPCTEPLHSMHMACASAHCVLTPTPGLPPTRCTRLHGCAWGLWRCGGLMRRAVLHTTPPALKPCTEPLHSMHVACASAHCVLRPAPGLPPT